MVRIQVPSKHGVTFIPQFHQLKIKINFISYTELVLLSTGTWLIGKEGVVIFTHQGSIPLFWDILALKGSPHHQQICQC